jgi:5-methylcytosine-specific restriction endonuclease McrA
VIIVSLEKKAAKKRSKTKKASKKSKRKTNLHSWLKQKLRRLSYQWPEMREATVKARVERGKYKCASCEGIFGPKEINRDHINPVDDVETGFTNWDNYIDRLFCSADLIQILCKTCHSYKSSLEQTIRAQVKRQKLKEKFEDDGDI